MSDHPWKYEDPNKSHSRKGLLLSNEIEMFCAKGLLIEEKSYNPEMVRPASYTLTVGPDYVGSDGRIKRLDKRQKYFYMEPSSIVYVSSAETLDLPFYVAARFNLRVDWVYKGILLGTGPQVDPGFRGNLSCPLFNLTDKPIRIGIGDPFATIDFERTSDFCNNKPWEEVKDTFREKGKLDEVTADGQRYLMFPQKPFKPLQKIPEYDIVSSLAELSREVKTWRNISIAVVVAFVSLALTLLNFQSNLYRDNRAFAQQLNDLQTRVVAQEKQINSGTKTEPVNPKPQSEGATHENTGSKK